MDSYPLYTLSRGGSSFRREAISFVEIAVGFVDLFDIMSGSLFVGMNRHQTPFFCMLLILRINL